MTSNRCAISCWWCGGYSTTDRIWRSYAQWHCRERGRGLCWQRFCQWIALCFRRGGHHDDLSSGSSQAAALLYSPHAYFSDIKVNQDGAGPLSADIDATSGGTDIKAFKPAKVIQNIPGVAGFSTSSTMDYEVKVQLPSGMKCSGVVGNTKNVCIMRVRNNAISGPFGGSAAFTNWCVGSSQKLVDAYRLSALPVCLCLSVFAWQLGLPVSRGINTLLFP